MIWIRRQLFAERFSGAVGITRIQQCHPVGGLQVRQIRIQPNRASKLFYRGREVPRGDHLAAKQETGLRRISVAENLVDTLLPFLDLSIAQECHSQHVGNGEVVSIRFLYRLQ